MRRYIPHETETMKQKRHTPEEIVRLLREAEASSCKGIRRHPTGRWQRAGLPPGILGLRGLEAEQQVDWERDVDLPGQRIGAVVREVAPLEALLALRHEDPEVPAVPAEVPSRARARFGCSRGETRGRTGQTTGHRPGFRRGIS